MTAVLVALWIVGAAVLASSIRANRCTSLLPTMFWTSVAWIAIGWWQSNTDVTASHIALALTSAAGVSVLGARRPGAWAWQFVVIGLLGVMHLPLIESHMIGTPLVLTGLRLMFLMGLIGTAVLNYLPTRFGLSAILVGLWATLSLWNLVPELARIAIGSVPLISWLTFSMRRPSYGETNQLWHDFRDRFGMIWALRMMEQFNRSAANSGSATTLKWNGLSGPDGPDTYERLCAVLKRFGMPPT